MTENLSIPMSNPERIAEVNRIIKIFNQTANSSYVQIPTDEKQLYLRYPSDRARFVEGPLPIIEHLVNSNLLRKGDRVLDMGSNNGLVVYLLSKIFGFDSYGIEINSSGVYNSILTLNNLGIEPKIAHGNVFPKNYPIDEKIKWGTISVPNRTEIDNNDPYQKLGLSIEEVDLFYLYQYKFNIYEMIEMISHLGKNGAYIVSAGYAHLKRLQEETGVELPTHVEHIIHLEFGDLLQIKKH